MLFSWLRNGKTVIILQEMDKVKLLLAHAEDKSEHASNRQKESREMQQVRNIFRWIAYLSTVKKYEDTYVRILLNWQFIMAC